MQFFGEIGMDQGAGQRLCCTFNSYSEKVGKEKEKEKLHTHDPDKLIRAKHQGESLNSLPTDKVYFKLIVLKAKSYGLSAFFLSKP